MVESNFNIFPTINFSVFSESQITNIHYASLDILKNTGSLIFNNEAITLLKKSGCRINGNIVKVPSYLIDKAISSAPKQITIFNCIGEKAIELEGRKIYFGTGPTSPFTLDVHTNERRLTKVSDIEIHTKVADSLQNIDFVMPLGSVSDVPKNSSDIYEFIATIKYTDKPIPFITWNKENFKAIIEIASLFSGGIDSLLEKPFLIQYPEPTSPLTHTDKALEKLLYSAELGIPMVYVPTIIMGGTGPMDIYGSLIQGNSENLMGLLISQLKNEGTPFIMGLAVLPLNMSNGLVIIGAPEFYLAMAAYAQVCQYYRIPSWGFGGLSDSKVIDEQAAIEASFCTFMAALSGVNLIHGFCELESCLTGSAEMIVMQDEVIGFIKRIMKNINCDNDKTIRNIINKVGPGGNYLMEEHTLRNFKSIWQPTVFDRNNYKKWQDEGSKDYKQRLKKKTIQIINGYDKTKFSKEILRDIEIILKKYGNI